MSNIVVAGSALLLCDAIGGSVFVPLAWAVCGVAIITDFVKVMAWFNNVE